MKINIRVEGERTYYGDSMSMAKRIAEIETICCEELAKISAAAPIYSYCVEIGVTSDPKDPLFMEGDKYRARYMTGHYNTKDPAWADSIKGRLTETEADMGTVISIDVYGIIIEATVQCHGAPNNVDEIMSYRNRLRGALKQRIFGT